MCGASAEHFCFGFELDVNFQSDNRLVGHRFFFVIARRPKADEAIFAGLLRLFDGLAMMGTPFLLDGRDFFKRMDLQVLVEQNGIDQEHWDEENIND